jgi:hypothetical protein
MAIVETLLYKSPDMRNEESWYMMQDSDTGKIHFEREWDNLSHKFEVSQGRKEVEFDELPQKAKDKVKSL